MEKDAIDDRRDELMALEAMLEFAQKNAQAMGEEKLAKSIGEAVLVARRCLHQLVH